VQRKAYVPGLTALVAALVAGCTAGTSADGSATDSKAGGPESSVATPGKYRNLPEPCGSVELSTLKDLLPGAAQQPKEQQRKVYRGTADVTYDTDRHVGCGWKAAGPYASHQLRVDFERVVSYDTAVSDDDQAQEVFAKKQAAASLPTALNPRDEKGKQAASPSSPTRAATDTDAADTDTDTDTPPAAEPPATQGTDATGSATPSPAQIPEGLEPRVLEGLGDAAFLDDVLVRAGSSAQHRTVSVVFRTSNVIVTIQYVEQPARTTQVPDSKELQEKVQSLALKLADQFDE
jgi:hypothetical protein